MGHRYMLRLTYYPGQYRGEWLHLYPSRENDAYLRARNEAAARLRARATLLILGSGGLP